MNKSIILLLISTILLSPLSAQITMESMFTKEGENHEYFIEKGFKRFLIKSGMRVVVNEGFGATIDTIFWDKWGFREATYSYNKKKALKGKKGLKPTSVRIMDGANMYNLNVKENSYMRMNNPITKTLGDMEGDDFIKNEEEFVTSFFDGKELEPETVDGKLCQVFEVLGGKSWVYKGIAWKTDAKVLGIRAASRVSMMKEGNVPIARLTLPKDAKDTFESLKGNK